MHKLYNALTTQYFKKRFRVPGFETGSGISEPVRWNRFLRQITIRRMTFNASIRLDYWRENIRQHDLNVDHHFECNTAT